MTRGPRVGRRAVGTHFLGAVLDTIYKAGHDGIRRSGTGQQTRPVTAALVAAQFQSDSHCRTEELCIVVNTRLEVGDELGIPLTSLLSLGIDTEHSLVALEGPACYEEGYADEGHIVHELVSLDIWIRL